MKARITHWLTPPVFLGDEKKTRRAILLNMIINGSVIYLLLLAVSNVLGRKIPSSVILVDILAILTALLSRYWLQRGNLRRVEVVLPIFGFLWITLANAMLGTIRTPTTSLYLFMVILFGLLFELRGILISTIASSLAVLGLILAENAGLLPQPDYTVTLTQWLTYTGLFGIAGSLVLFTLQTTRKALERAEKEIQERMRVEHALKNSQARLLALMESTQQSFVLMDTAANILSFNRVAAQNARAVFDREMHEGDSMLTFVLDRDIAQFNDDFNRSLQGEIITVEKSFVLAVGIEHWFSFIYSPAHTENGDVLGVCFNTIDVTEHKQTEQALRKLSRAVEQSPSSIVITDLDGIIEYVNPRFTQVTGYSFHEAVGQNPRILKTNRTPFGTHRQLWNTITAGEEWHGEFVNRRKDGSYYYEAATISPIIDPKGVTTHYLAVKEDITERKNVEEALKMANEELKLRVMEVEKLQADLRKQALHDPLTGLYNRRYLNETLIREIARSERENHPVSLIISDIDHFKKINDTYGHHAGDKFLVEVAQLMRRCARGSDFICRYGGEEFLLVLPGITARDAEKRAEEIRQKCAKICIQYEGHNLAATMSFGLATYPVHGREAEEIIMKADKALYISKSTGRNRVTVWNE